MFTHQELLAETAKLRKFAMRLARNADDAEDLLQSTVLRALEKQDYFKTDTNLFSWMSKIMFNLFVSEYRKKKRYDTQFDPETRIRNAAVGGDQDARVELRLVREAMDSLTDEHRQILTLVCIRDKRYDEVARELDIPVGTVRSRLSRARGQLQAAMERNAMTRRSLHRPVAAQCKQSMGGEPRLAA